MPESPRELLDESVVTPPSEWCPFPSRWHSTDDESTELEVTELVAAFVRAIQPDNVLETGTAFGQTTAAICDAIDKNAHGHLYTLDFNVQRQQRTKIALARPEEIVTYVSGSSFDYEFDAMLEFQFAFIDCDFGKRDVVFRHFYNHFPVGAIVAFHDMSPGFTNGPHGWGAGLPLLTPLVNEGLMQLIKLRTPRGVVFAEVL